MKKDNKQNKKEKVLSILKKGLPFVGMAFTFLLGLCCGSCSVQRTSETHKTRTAVIENVDTGVFSSGGTDIVSSVLGTTASGLTGYLWNIDNGGSAHRMEASINLGIEIQRIVSDAPIKYLGQYWTVNQQGDQDMPKSPFTKLIFNDEGSLLIYNNQVLADSIDERDFGAIDLYIQFYPTSYSDINDTAYDYIAYTTTYSKDEINRNFSLADLFTKYFNIEPVSVDKNGNLVIYQIDPNVYFDVFDLLGSAFTSLGGLLGIAILPSITLGTLLFIPLVVIIILFIVGLFKR